MLSGLSQQTLAHIWSLSDVNQDGRLDAQEFCCAMALISGVSEGKTLPQTLPQSIVQVIWPTTVSQGSTPAQPTGPVDSVWTITDFERSTDKKIFEESHVNGFIEGNSAVTIFSQSGLSITDLAQIYGIADMDADGKLTQPEFLVAMKLVRVRLAGIPLPVTIPSELIASIQSVGGVKNEPTKSESSGLLETRISELEANLEKSVKNLATCKDENLSLVLERDKAIEKQQELELQVSSLQGRVGSLTESNNQLQQKSSQLESQLETVNDQVQQLVALKSQLEAQLQQQTQLLQSQQSSSKPPSVPPPSIPSQPQNLARFQSTTNPFAHASSNNNPFMFQ
eukprot:TRINITY_DN3162_c0_g1_i8.p1 TRINITY_DN3162_c0_g1~~TRINITY_DN3162_c0_g1_i8.p1  ORF type:complete len:339 (-),score=97.27 TRINITY_DN3162_c0_g1_i8:239-1255(-)